MVQSSEQRESYYLFQYRILIFLLYKDYEYVKYDPETRHMQILKMSKFSTDVGYLSARIRDGLRELARLNLIYGLKLSHNKASFYLEEMKNK